MQTKSTTHAERALADFNASFPLPTAENRAYRAELQSIIDNERAATGELFDDQAAEREKWAAQNEALADQYPSAAAEYRETARLFRLEAAELRRKAVVARAATFGVAA